jgi:hypothetical protein
MSFLGRNQATAYSKLSKAVLGICLFRRRVLVKYKKETLTLSVLILLVSFLNFNVQTEAAVSDLQVNPVPGFSGQMCSSAFTSNGTFL